MTREEAIVRLQAEIEDYTPFKDKYDGAKADIEALTMAIKALEQEPKYCDRNVCLQNEYNGIGCEDCEVTKSQKALEQEPVLDKIRAEIVELRSKQNVGVLECLDIIDKYKAESEG